MNAGPKRTFTLTLQTSNDATTIHRVRAALKSLLRRWNLRCTGIEEIPIDTEGNLAGQSGINERR
jgi:hypothetical protein